VKPELSETLEKLKCFFVNVLKLLILFTNIDQKLQNKLLGPIHYKIGVACVFNNTILRDILCCNTTKI